MTQTFRTLKSHSFKQPWYMKQWSISKNFPCMNNSIIIYYSNYLPFWLMWYHSKWNKKKFPLLPFFFFLQGRRGGEERRRKAKGNLALPPPACKRSGYGKVTLTKTNIQLNSPHRDNFTSNCGLITNGFFPQKTQISLLLPVLENCVRKLRYTNNKPLLKCVLKSHALIKAVLQC